MRPFKILACLLLAGTVYVQARDFTDYQDYFKKMDVTITAPPDMTCNADSVYTLDVNPDLRIPGCGHKYPNIGWLYDVAFESKDDDAVMLFPTVMGYMAQLDGVAELEIQASHNDQNLDVRKHLTVIAGKDMSQYAEADTAIVYQFDLLGKPFMDKYTHVTGIYLRKYAHPSLMLKIVTNDKGLAKKDEYVKRILDCVKFGNEVSEEGLKWEKDYPGGITILDKSPSVTATTH